jgi:lysozyme family protein
MSNLDKVITEIIEREGGSKATNDPKDPGGRTQYGISERANPQAWADGKVTESEAREIFLQKYVVWPKFHTIPPSHKNTQEQLIDFGVHSGPGVAVMKLQETLNEAGADPKLKVDGDFGQKTLNALLGTDDRSINNLFMAARIKMLGRVVQKNPNQLNKLSGFLNRALGFLR